MSAAVSFSPYQKKWVELKEYQLTDDIIKALMTEHLINHHEYDRVCDSFWTGNIETTARKLYDYCKKHIRYKIEPDEKQTVRTPGAILAIGSGDCKHYASFINGVLDALSRKGKPINCLYRFASYDIFSSDPHHVFAVVKDGNNEIWIDPVLKKFNDRKMYYYKKDKKPLVMSKQVSGIGALYRVSGINATTIYDHFNRPYPAIENSIADIGRKKNKAAKAAKHKKPKKKGRFLKVLKKLNPLGASARNSYLLLLRLNVFHLASNIMKKVYNHPDRVQRMQKLKAKWEKLGGNWKSFDKAVRAGAAVWNKHHPKNKIKISGISGIGAADLQDMGIYGVSNLYGWGFRHCPINGIGVVPVAAPATAIITAAATIIAAMRPLLKSFGVSEEKNMKEEDAAINAGATDMAEKAEDAKDAMQDGMPINDEMKTGSGTPGVKYSVTDNQDGTKTINIKDTNFDASDGTEKNVPGAASSGDDSLGLGGAWDRFKNFVVANKKPLIITGCVVVGLPILYKVVQSASSSKPKRRR